MTQLTPEESRVLGVLIEKAYTTPEGYPMTLNSLVNGANQKSNRNPVTEYDEGDVLRAVNGLKAKGLVVEVHTAGSRTSKYRQEAGQKLGLGKAALVLLAELMLRGPQTVGELRGRASRMQPFETIEQVRATLDLLIERNPPLIRRLPPPPGSRAELFVQLLTPDSQPAEAAYPSDEPIPADQPIAPAPSVAIGQPVEQRIAQLEDQLARLTQAVRKLAEALGEPDPLADPQPADPSAG